MPISAGPKIVKDSSLILNLDIGNKKSYSGSGTSCTDLTRGKYAGTFYGGLIYNPSVAYAGAAALDGVDDFVSIPMNGTSLTAVTVEFWVYINQHGSPFQWANSMSSGSPWILFNYNTGSEYRLYVDGNYRISTTLNKFTWYNVQITYTSSTWTLYINGVSVGTYTGTIGSMQSNAITICLGNGYNSYLGGNISSLRVYNRALSATEVQQNYYATKQKYVEIPKTISGLQLWLDASDLSTLRQNSNGTTIVSAANDPIGYWADKSGNGRHATQATAGNRPLYKIDSYGPYVNLDGSTSVMTGSWPLTLTEMSFFAVFTIGNGGYNSGRVFTHYNSTLSSYDWNTTSNLITMFKNSNMNKISFSVVGSNTSTYHTLNYNQNYIYGLYHNGSVGTSYVNNSDYQSITYNHNFTYNTYLIGREPNYNGYVLGTVREFIYYNRLLSMDERRVITNYLNKKWNVF